MAVCSRQSYAFDRKAKIVRVLFVMFHDFQQQVEKYGFHMGRIRK